VKTAAATKRPSEGDRDVTTGPEGPDGTRISFWKRAARAARQGLVRVLRLFAEIKPDELGTAVLLTANVFLLLSAYYLLKIVREPLILSR